MATSYLKRTPSSPGSNTTGTVSAWVKYDQGAGTNTIIGGNEGSSSTDRSLFSITSDGTVYNQIVDGGSAYTQISDRLLRDPAAWYHVVFQFDTSNGVQADRVKTFINNEQITSWSTTALWPSSVDIKLWDSAASAEYMIGCRKSSSSYQYFFSGNMAHVHVVDGTIYAPSVFAETDSTSGIWIPITAPSVTYGTNGGFYKFASGALGTDSAGSNDMTAVGNLTSVKDNPENNFCTFNPLDNYYQASTFTNGNSTVTTHAGNYTWNTATIGLTSGKWYWECKGGTNISQVIVAICSKLSPGSTTEITSDAASITMEMGSGGVLKGGVSEYSGTAYTTSDVCGIAMDLDNNKYYLALDNVWKNSGVPTSGATGTGAVDITTPIPNTGFYFPAQADPSSSLGGECFWNFGNGYFGTTAVTSAEADGNGEGAFEYAPPTGYFAICTNNLGSES